MGYVHDVEGICQQLDAAIEKLRQIDRQIEARGMDLVSRELSFRFIERCWRAGTLCNELRSRVQRLIGKTLSLACPHGGDRRSKLGGRPSGDHPVRSFGKWITKPALRKIGALSLDAFDSCLRALTDDHESITPELILQQWDQQSSGSRGSPPKHVHE